MEDDELRCCSFAVTGKNLALQEIYVCGTVASGRCVCQNCAQVCHGEDEVTFVGIGAAYCDCHEGDCQILKRSNDAAAGFGIPPGSLPLDPGAATEPYCEQVFDVLNFAAFQQQLETQASLLVQHSRDTFWLDEQSPKVILLEKFAWEIFQHHQKTSQLEKAIGAEWWVQVKRISDKHSVHYANGEEAVDLHYDKDEELALFGLGAFPTLSTVTYVSDTPSAPPTLIFGKQYTEPLDMPIENVLISHPAAGKHLVFDGRLLHGAPTHFELRRPASSLSSVRVTFLVNIWGTHKPLGIQELSEDIRSAVSDATDSSSGPIDLRLDLKPRDDSCTTKVVVDDKHESNLSSREDPIVLPFIGGKSTWSTADNDDCVCLQMFPPAIDKDYDTTRVRFGPGYEALLCEMEPEDGEFTGS